MRGIAGKRPEKAPKRPENHPPGRLWQWAPRALAGLAVAVGILLVVAVVWQPGKSSPPVTPTGDKTVQPQPDGDAISKRQALELYEAIVAVLKADERRKMWATRVDEGRKAELDADVIEQMEGARVGEEKARQGEASKVADMLVALNTRYKAQAGGIADVANRLAIEWDGKGAKPESDLLLRAVDALKKAPAGAERQALNAVLAPVKP